MRYLLLKDWNSKRHGKIIKKGAYVVITIESEIQDLIENECIEAPKKKKKKVTKQTEENEKEQ